MTLDEIKKYTAMEKNYKFRIKYTVDETVEFTEEEIKDIMYGYNGNELEHSTGWDILEAVKNYMSLPSNIFPERTVTINEISFTK